MDAPSEKLTAPMATEAILGKILRLLSSDPLPHGVAADVKSLAEAYAQLASAELIFNTTF